MSVLFIVSLLWLIYTNCTNLRDVFSFCIIFLFYKIPIFASKPSFVFILEMFYFLNHWLYFRVTHPICYLTFLVFTINHSTSVWVVLLDFTLSLSISLPFTLTNFLNFLCYFSKLYTYFIKVFSFQFLYYRLFKGLNRLKRSLIPSYSRSFYIHI